MATVTLRDGSKVDAMLCEQVQDDFYLMDGDDFDELVKSCHNAVKVDGSDEYVFSGARWNFETLHKWGILSGLGHIPSQVRSIVFNATKLDKDGWVKIVDPLPELVLPRE